MLSASAGSKAGRSAVAEQPGNALRNLGRFDEAEKSLRRALQLKPDFANAHYNLGNVLYDLGRATEAQASYRTALRLRPDMTLVHGGLRNALLITGQFEEGWKEEWHWMKDKAPPFPEPLWNGEAIGDRVILLPAFEGYGDTIQFCRYAPQITARRVIHVVRPALVRLLSRLSGVSEVIAFDDPLPSFDL